MSRAIGRDLLKDLRTLTASPGCPKVDWPSRRPPSWRCTEPAQQQPPAATVIKADRQRHLDRDIERLREIFADTYLPSAQVEVAIDIQLAALLRVRPPAAATTRRRRSPIEQPRCQSDPSPDWAA